MLYEASKTNKILVNGPPATRFGGAGFVGPCSGSFSLEIVFFTEEDVDFVLLVVCFVAVFFLLEDLLC